MQTLFIFMFLFVETSIEASACVWQNGENPFWQSNEIQICFVDPASESMDPNERQARRLIKEAVEREFNNRTNISFTGFQSCEHNYHRQGENNSLPPMIRMELSPGFGSGQAHSIGPASSTSHVNIRVDYLSVGSTSEEPRTRAPIDMQDEALHELMHLLGFHHGFFHTNSKAAESYENLIFLNEYDPQSITIPAPTRDPTGRFTAADIECINKVADRSINRDANLNSITAPVVDGPAKVSQ